MTIPSITDWLSHPIPEGAWKEWAIAALILGVTVAVAYVVFRLIFTLLVRLTHLSDTDIDTMVVEKVRHPVKWAVIALTVTIVAQTNETLLSFWEPFAGFLRPALLGWIAYTLVRALTAALEARLDDTADPVAMRSRRTRIAILSRTATFTIIVIAVGLMLLSVPGVRDIGTTLLASAGLAALAIGAAAQPALKSLIAGLQMALTEPLRIGDMVKVDGEVGRVEEIRISFVTIRTWDKRVVVVPTTRFLDDSFENWSRQSEELTGPVFLQLDPIAEVAPIRAEFLRYVGEHALWDNCTAALLMTEAHPETIELRMAVSAETIGDLWTLRCDVREHMVDWLRREHPDWLIRHRLEVEAANARAG